MQTWRRGPAHPKINPHQSWKKKDCHHHHVDCNASSHNQHLKTPGYPKTMQPLPHTWTSMHTMSHEVCWCFFLFSRNRFLPNPDAPGWLLWLLWQPPAGQRFPAATTGCGSVDCAVPGPKRRERYGNDECDATSKGLPAHRVAGPK